MLKKCHRRPPAVILGIERLPQDPNEVMRNPMDIGFEGLGVAVTKRGSSGERRRDASLGPTEINP
jgi:hypothetical protein